MDAKMKKILVIDDEQPTLKMFRLFLSAYGYEVLTEESGESGLECFEKEQPDIVLTDVKMPGMDGIEVLKRIKEKRPRTEVIVITGHGDMDLAIQALNMDATDFINKPVNRQALEQALKKAGDKINRIGKQSNDVETEVAKNAVILKIRGNIGADAEDRLSRALKSVRGYNLPKMILTFDPNASINGAGIAVLTQLLLEMQKQDIQVDLAGLPENFQKVFDIVGISKLAAIRNSVEEALSA